MPRGKDAPVQMPLRETPLLMLVDGHALVHRAWHAIQRPLTLRDTGEDVRGVYGFTATLLKALQEFHPTHLAVAFDRPSPTFRHREFAGYKAQRPEAPPELRHQFARVREVLQAFRIPVYEVDGFEADDVIGTLCLQAEEGGLDTVILTGDTDTLQLVSERVRVALYYRIQERVLYDPTEVRRRYGGVPPERLPDLKALTGDPTDNIPGVPGVGEKTAIRLLVRYGSLEGLYAHLGEIQPERLRRTLEEHRDAVFRWRDLTTIRRDAPVSLDLEATRFWRYSRREVVEVLRRLEFASLVDRVPEGAPEAEPSPTPATAEVGEQAEYTLVRDEEALSAWVDLLARAPQFSFDVETTETDPMRADLVGLSFAVAPGRACYIPVGHREGPNLPLGQVLERLRPLLEDPRKPKVGHNANFDMTALGAHGVQVRGVAFDTMLASQLLGERSAGLKTLAFRFFGEEMTPIKALLGTGPRARQKTMAMVPVEEAGPYACADADWTLRLRQVLEARLREEGLWPLFAELEMPLLPVLVRMQLTGVRVDTALLARMSQDLEERLRDLERRVFDLVGHAFNLNSPRQLSEVLFGELRLPKTKRTHTGYTTDAQALEQLRERLRTEAVEGVRPQALEVLDLILQYRELSKLKSTYLDALPRAVNPRTGRVHTSYNQIGAATGRIISSEPNLQNIPVRTEMGRRIREAFVPEPGWRMLGADYSQVELRILAHLSRDPALLEAFRQDLDIHAATASLVFGVPVDRVTPEQRRVAKTLNFGVIYGMSAFGVSQQTGMSPEEAHRFIQDYFARFPGVRRYIEETLEKARTRGYVETLLGRRRRFAEGEIHARDPNLRQAVEREAINMPVQGTAADLIKRAMVRLQERMDREGLRARMVLQVHDELVFEVPPEEVEALRSLVEEVMPRAMDLAVPLKVEVRVGDHWGQLH